MMFLLYGCGGSISGPDTNPANTDPVDTDPTDTVPGDTGAASEPAVTEDSIGAQDVDDLEAWIFDDTYLHEVAIELPATSVESLWGDPWSYAPGSLVLDGEPVIDVGVRLRGKIGSFRDLNGKPKLKIDFNRYVDGQRFYGLESLSLNNAVVDCSYLKEALALRVFGAIGVPTMRTSFASVSINGAPYGLYVILETPDDRFLQEHYADPTGNLYDGKYVWYGGYNYQLLDFASGVDHLYSLEEGEEVDNADIAAVSQALAESAGTDAFYDRMGEVIDWEIFHREQVAEQWVGQLDGYGLNKNNYRLYFNPETGLMEIIPWDMDYSFLYDATWGRSWASPYGAIAYYCRIDATCNARQREIAAELLEAVDELDLVETTDRLAQLTEAAAYADPRRECSWAYVEAYRAEVRSWVERRSDEMRTFWGLP